MKFSIDHRFWEIDVIRGSAIFLMVLFHILYDMTYVGGWEVDLQSPLWYYLVVSFRMVFVFIVGLSLTLSDSRQRISGKTAPRRILKYFMRGAVLLSIGFMITAATYFTYPGFTIYWGVLHFIGLAIIMAIPFIKLRWSNLIFAAISAILGFILPRVDVGTVIFVPFGLTPQGFWSVDYFPMFPGFAFVLSGITVGNLLYRNHMRQFFIKDLSRRLSVRFLTFCGRHALAIYLIHQPIIVGAVLLLIELGLI